MLVADFRQNITLTRTRFCVKMRSDSARTRLEIAVVKLIKPPIPLPSHTSLFVRNGAPLWFQFAVGTIW